MNDLQICTSCQLSIYLMNKKYSMEKSLRLCARNLTYNNLNSSEIRGHLDTIAAVEHLKI